MFWSGIRGGGFFPFSTEGWIALLLGIGITLIAIIAVVYASKKFSQLRYKYHYGENNYSKKTLRALNQKYKNGEINRDEYETMKNNIEQKMRKERGENHERKNE